jgi:tagaturonate epimerase
MTALQAVLQYPELAPPLELDQAEQLALELGQLSCLTVYPRSITAARQSLFFLGRRDMSRQLGILTAGPMVGAFSGASQVVRVDQQPLSLIIGRADANNAAALRVVLPFLVPRPLGLKKSIGCGDRLGLATPGHIRAVRAAQEAAAGCAMAPILAQQSMRENARTGRPPQQVLDEAMWGVFQEGWRAGYGADADHLKTTQDVERCADAGYSFFTIDPGEHVDDSANTARPEVLREKAEGLPWEVLDSNVEDTLVRLTGSAIDLGTFNVTLGEEEVLRAVAKYGRAVAQTVTMYRHARRAAGLAGLAFELEMSVDETSTLTTLAEHIYVANELKRLDVEWVSLAPRYFGRFEKGVDYLGESALGLEASLVRFEETFTQHVAVAKTFGPYKLSLHSGSDKFSIYPIAARVGGNLIHLKTAGTSYLEALRAIARLDSALFRDIAAFAVSRYATDRATYHVSADPSQLPALTALADEQLPSLLDDFHGREVLHVTFGSVLNEARFKDRFFASLRANEELYYGLLAAHFERHISPFTHGQSSAS